MNIRGKFFSFIFVAVLVTANSVSASAVVNAISGKVVDNSNRAIANTSVTVSKGGVNLGTVVTDKQGAYAFNLDAGAYSLSFVPPTKANGTLKAYDIIAPMAKPMTVQLTTPMPGRAYLSGSVTTSPAMKLASDSTIYLGSVASSLIKSDNSYRMMPTAGTNAALRVKAASIGNFSFSLYQKNSMEYNQDTIANFVVPVVYQKIRVVNAEGTPIVGAMVEGGQGSYGTDFADFGLIEGLGSFTAGWKNRAYTDANGYANIQTVKMAAPSTAGFYATAPASYLLMGQQFSAETGTGDITLVMTKKSSAISGFVRDSSGGGIPGVDIYYAGFSASTNAAGAYAKPAPSNLIGNYALSYRTGAFTFGSSGTSVQIDPVEANKISSNNGRVQDFVLKLDNVSVKVIDSSGAPVAKAFVNLTDADGYYPRGQYTLLPGMVPHIGKFTSNAMTDATGVAKVRTLRLDNEILGVVTVTPTAGSVLSWTTARVMVGAGNAVTVTLARPTVAVSGKVSFSDGTPMAPLSVVFNDGKGGDQGSAIVDPTTGNYSMRVPKGMKGTFYIGCPTERPTEVVDPLCIRTSGATQTISTDTVFNITVPTYKTPVHIVSPYGKGLANIDVLFNVGFGMAPCSQFGNILGANSPSPVVQFSRVTTDANGWAQMPLVSLAGPCEAYVLITPDANSRYQTRNLLLTVGDGATNTIVLTIPSPEVYSKTTVTNASGSLITLTGLNFLGVFGVKFNGVEQSVFKVLSNTLMSFVVPPGNSNTGEIVVTNGGGSYTYSVR